MSNRRLELVLLVAMLTAIAGSVARAQCCAWDDPYADLSEKERSAIFWHDVTVAGLAVAAFEDALAKEQPTDDAGRINDLAKSAFLSWFDVFNGFRRRPPDEFAQVDDWEGALLAATQALNDAGFSVVVENDRKAAIPLLAEFRTVLASVCEGVGRPSLSAAIVRARETVAQVRLSLEKQATDDLPGLAKTVQTAADRLREAPAWAPPAGVQMPEEQVDRLTTAFPQRRLRVVSLLEAAAAALTAGEAGKVVEVLGACEGELRGFASSYGRALF